MTSNFRTALSAVALVAGLAATPALAQLTGAQAGGAAAGGAVMHGGGAAIGGGGFGGGQVGAPVAAPAAPMTAPQVHAAPAIVPQAQAPQVHVPQVHVPQVRGAESNIRQVAPGGGYAAPRIHDPGRTPLVRRSPGFGADGVTTLPHQRRAWPGHSVPPGVATRPHDSAQMIRGRHHRGRGHWRGGVWYPTYLGDTYSSYDYDDEECTLRKVRVHTPYGWRRVWRRVCT